MTARELWVSLGKWCPQRDSNSRPTDYKSVAVNFSGFKGFGFWPIFYGYFWPVVLLYYTLFFAKSRHFVSLSVSLNMPTLAAALVAPNRVKQ
jgi:hypothetical protein